MEPGRERIRRSGRGEGGRWKETERDVLVKTTAAYKHACTHTHTHTVHTHTHDRPLCGTHMMA